MEQRVVCNKEATIHNHAFSVAVLVLSEDDRGQEGLSRKINNVC